MKFLKLPRKVQLLSGLDQSKYREMQKMLETVYEVIDLREVRSKLKRGRDRLATE